MSHQRTRTGSRNPHLSKKGVWKDHQSLGAHTTRPHAPSHKVQKSCPGCGACGVVLFCRVGVGGEVIGPGRTTAGKCLVQSDGVRAAHRNGQYTLLQWRACTSLHASPACAEGACEQSMLASSPPFLQWLPT
ncbi:hypothetical protein WJX73_009889 [Symbiochloris irregularis]|uniref:Uncharacterized protein n=1 Tax=Symbiochloris irregularis TaxID=706552 RepID=A0AAW1PCA0_9CHLO